MKKTLIFLSLFAFSGCGSDGGGSSEPTLFRKWYYKDVTSGGVTVPYPDHESCGKDYISFYGYDRVRGVDIDDCEHEIDWERQFTFVDNILTIYDDTFSLSATVTRLDKEYLIYEYDDDLDGDGSAEHHIVRFTSR